MIIEARNISKHFDDLRVLNNINLNIKKGEVVSIVGASGAGKTTLLQILGTLDKPDLNNSASLIINGTDVLKLKDKNLSKFRNLNLGFIFQFHQLLPEFNALENICIPAMIAKTNTKEAEKKALELLDYLDFLIVPTIIRRNYLVENNKELLLRVR